MGLSEVRVFTFSADWGLPTTGPFALKLLGWMNLAGIPYEQVFQDDSRKGPLGKSPWIEHRGRRIGDSDIIIRYLAAEYGVSLDDGLDERDRAVGHALKTAFEERFHQILEWELFVHPAGAAYIDGLVRARLPPLVGPLVGASVKRRFARQLHARGIGRHPPSTIADLGRAEIDMLSAFLGDRPFLFGDRPLLPDLAVFGQVAPLVCWPMETPVARHARSVPNVVSLIRRIGALGFSRL
jgi:glutathione S-transferase